MKLTRSQAVSDKEFLRQRKAIFARALNFIKPIALPVLLAMIPALYHYGNNVEKLILANLWQTLLFNMLLVILFYFVAGVFNRFHPVRTAIATSIFLLFFNVYGLVYRFLLDLDIVRIKHYTFLPLVLMLAVYTILPVTKLSSLVLVKAWKNLLLIAAVLVIYNSVRIVPAEVLRWRSESAAALQEVQEDVLPAEELPDIYYIILDEFAGFQAMREYWGYEEVDHFVGFLKDRGFFVAEESHGSTTDTLHEIATRLNFQEYPIEETKIQTYFNEIADNRVMRELKSRGYTTVVLDETNMSYTSSKSIRADYVYEHGSPAIPQGRTGTYGVYFDEFGELVMDNTMLYAISENYKKNNPLVNQHRDMISFATSHIASKDMPSPKFVYVHLMLPHFPFAFDRNGGLKDNEHFTNWNHYLDNYIFSINVAESMIRNILLDADANNPPVIILQSDHGVRNSLAAREGSVILPNYPEDYKTLIMYALYLPGYDYSNLPSDINPINTFPIVFNHLFDVDIPLIK